MNATPITVLFLCTGNSARSILAEALLNALGTPRFRGLSAGSHPTGQPNPHALAALRRAGIATDGLRSKSWDEFADGPRIDLVITVCDSAAGERCPLFPGEGTKAHWGIPDPAGDADPDTAFAGAFDVLRRRVRRLVDLPLERLDPVGRSAALDGIAKAEPWRP